MMYEVNIQLDTFAKVKDFVGAITGFEGEFDIYAGKYIVDGKSILGIFSVDLSKPLVLKVETTEDIEKIKEAISAFII